jgi:hypothetical protein
VAAVGKEIENKELAGSATGVVMVRLTRVFA